jgi:hypothetical protein
MAAQLIPREGLQLYSLGVGSLPSQGPTTLYTQPKEPPIQEFSNKSFQVCEFEVLVAMKRLWFSLCLITQVKQLAEKARTGKLAPNEFQGGTFRQVHSACLFFWEFYLLLKYNILTF